MAQTGTIYLVGAGPGDPDLLTLRAARLIESARVIVHDGLVDPAILALARGDAQLISVAKRRSHHTLPQEEISELLVRVARSGQDIVRLKGGDPFVFGRGGEEIEELAAHGVPFQVVPGITAANGCSAYAGIPLTHRDYAQSVRFVTGHLKDNSINLPWAELVHNQQTVVFYMGLIGLPVICEQLIAHGRSPDTPIAIIQQGTTANQKVVTATLATMVKTLEQHPVQAPTLIIVGEVVSLREKLAWYEQQGDLDT